MVAIETIEYEAVPIESPKHYTAIHGKKFFQQPKQIEMGKITNDFKRLGHATLYTTLEIIEALSSGHCAILANYEIDSDNRFRFVSSSLIAIDIDDDLEITEPLQVLEELNDICTGLFYTFSHGIKGNRYRLLFQLDEPIRQQQDFNILIEYLMDYLKSKSLPVDVVAKNVTQIVRPGLKGYELNNLHTKIKISEWLPKARIKAQAKLERLEKQRNSRAKQMNYNLYNPMTYEELKEMCEAIGYIPSGEGEETLKKWIQIVYALKNEVVKGELTEDEGYTLYCIISGPEENERYWNSLRPDGHVNIGSIVRHAEHHGYKRRHKYKHAQQETLETIPQERIKVKKYLNPDIAKELIQRKQKLIVDSPTGSRKTSSFMTAFQELASEEYSYYIFTAPTIILSEQIAKKYNVPCLTGETTNAFHSVTTAAVKGERLFISTYDKVDKLIAYLTHGIDYNGNKPEFIIAIDEIHEFIGSYGYRFRAIDKLQELTKVATSLIALTGTADFAFKDSYDALIKIETGNTKSPAMDFRVFTYHTRKVAKSVPLVKNGKTEMIEQIETDANLADVMLLPVFNALLKQTKVLAFINNKDRIQSIAKRLRKQGITVQVVTSDSKKSETYRSIAETETISDDVQVVLTTSVLSTGLSINNTLNWSCLVVSDKSSPFFNTSTIKQISNRFRQQYRYFCLYMREPNKDYADDKKFYIETDYQQKKRIVQSYVDYLNEEFTDENLKTFTTSKVENHNGIFYRSTDDEAVIEFNPMYVRYNSMKRSEQYYSTFRNAFVKEVERQLGVKCSAMVNVNDEAEKNNQDFSTLLEEIKEEQELKKADDSELREAFSQYFDEGMHKCFVRNNEEEIQLFKMMVHPTQFNAMKRLCPIADYETCRQIGMNIKKVADTHVFYNDIVSLVEIAAFESSKKTSVTKKVYRELLKIEGKTYPSADFKKMMKYDFPKKLKVQESDVKEALKLFHSFHSRTKIERLTTIRPLSIELVAKIRHSQIDGDERTELSEKSIRNTIIRYVYTQNENKQKVFLPAISEKYGIEKYED
ncbi:DEAD/DEAH box helicase [Solibacillus sp. FSL W8-0474]|uniref:DEAD/DEAH box helicase n=1 Tax=Solibacillus sp. FSL W8-0474 TaxID=2975336 RepID=UPI0030F61AEA